MRKPSTTIAESLGMLVVGLLLMPVADAHATVLCASQLGHLRLREACRRHEQIVDVRALAAAEADSVPLRDWKVLPGDDSSADSPRGIEAVAAASSSSMANLTPCRLIDTRPGTSSALPGDDIGPLASFQIRTYTLSGFCGIPSGATALSINLAVVPGAQGGFVSVGPGSSIPPFPPGPSFASINFVGAGPALSNSLIVPLDDQGSIDVYAAREADVIIDTNGYFEVSAANTLYVPGTGSASENGDALDAAVAEAGAGGASSLWVIELGPGVFDLGTSGISLSRQTALVGAGRQLTTITCNCVNPVVTVNLAASEVRALRVDNTSTNTSTADAIHITGADDTIVSNVYVTATGNDGIDISSSSDVLVEQVIAETGDVSVDFNTSVSGTVLDSTLRSSSAQVFQLSTNDVATIRNCSLERLNSGDLLQIQGLGATVSFFNSRLVSPGTLASGTAGTLEISNSFVDAASATFTGTSTCRGISTPSGFLTMTCP